MSRTKRATLGSTGIFAEERTAGTPAPAPATASSARQASASNRPDRAGRVAMPFWTTAAARKQLRLLAAELDGTPQGTQQGLMTEALNLLFTKHGKPPIA
jgi:hypothetical protein